MNNNISDQQHGFVKDKSCLTNLLETMDCIISILESGAPVDLIYLDFSKAFDRVPHFRLLSKLENLGIKGKLLNVVKDFLTNRKFRVSVEGKFSTLKDILSGIPQGSVLGPSLEITWFSCPDRTLKIMSQIKFDFLNQLIARSAISLKIKYESQIKSLRKS